MVDTHGNSFGPTPKKGDVLNLSVFYTFLCLYDRRLIRYLWTNFEVPQVVSFKFKQNIPPLTKVKKQSFDAGLFS